MPERNNEARKLDPTISKKIIDQYLTVTPEQRIKMWKSEPFLHALPFVIGYLLTPDGQQQYPPEKHAALATSFMQHLETVPIKLHNIRGDEHTHIHREYHFDTKSETLIRVATQIDPTTTRVRIRQFIHAASFILAASLPDDEFAKVVEIFSGKWYDYTLKDTLGILLRTDAAERIWAEKHGVAQSVLDQRVTRAIFTAFQGKPASLRRTNQKQAIFPRNLSGTEPADYYSDTAFELFLDEAVNLVETSQERLSKVTKEALLGLARNAVKRGEFSQQPHIRAAAVIVLHAIGIPQSEANLARANDIRTEQLKKEKRYVERRIMEADSTPPPIDTQE